MATALSNAPTIAWANSGDGTQPHIAQYPEGTSETFKKGDFVVFGQSENGLVIAPEGDGGVIGDSTHDEVADTFSLLGIALQDASGTAGTLISVLIPRATDRFSCVLYSTDNTTIVAPDIDNIGNAVDFIRGDTNNNFAVGVLEANLTSGGWAKIVDICHQDTTFRGGTVGATLPTYSAGDRVLVQFLPAALSYTGTVA